MNDVSDLTIDPETRARIENVLARMPGWQEKAALSPLKGGLTNQNFRVDAGGEAFVLRLAGKNTGLLGIDRDREAACARAAASVGLGAELVAFIEDAQALVLRFIEGQTLAAEDAANPEMLPRIATALKACHGGPAFPGLFSPFDTVRTYHALAKERGVAFPEFLPRVFALMERIEKALGRPERLVPCHNDLLAANFIDVGSGLRLIDWEYAAMGDPFFDLGNFAVNQDLGVKACRTLLEQYQGRARPKDLARLRLMCLASDLREAFWGFLQAGISKLDHDYRGYGLKHLERFLAGTTHRNFEGWLK